MGTLRKIYNALYPAYKAHYQAPKDSSLRSRALSPQAEKYQKAMNRAQKKGGSSGVGVGY